MNRDIEGKLLVIKIFFDTQVDCYILKDLERLINIEPSRMGSVSCGGCTIPTAMLIITSMEMFGTHLTDNPDQSTGKPEYLKRFIQEYIAEINERDMNSLVYNYRHKMMHVFFPKVDNPKMFGITKKPTNDDLINRNDALRPELNVLKLSSLFKAGVEKLRKKIFQDKNETLINTFYDNIHFPDSGMSTVTKQTTFPR